MAEGAIEGTASQYEVASPYATSFVFSRFGAAAIAGPPHETVAAAVDASSTERVAVPELAEQRRRLSEAAPCPPPAPAPRPARVEAASPPPAAVQALLEDKFPEGSRLAVERLADGATSGGFAWHREAEGVDDEGNELLLTRRSKHKANPAEKKKKGGRKSQVGSVRAPPLR